ncbi:hypothetical protein QL898_13720, partial [Psychrobacter sp. APC 3279]|uniref:hypothetical protein n=1 Tax=Psychrobacter sp. APC 3279 TaxID=3035189 RepID=UPI0025B2FD65
EPPGAGVVTKRDWNYAKEANQVKAMEKFIKDNEKPVATWTPQISNGNGFDYAYVRPNGQLVIVEAKSNNGYHTALTAFGGGKNPERTIRKNKDRLIKEINANRGKMTSSQYDSVIQQIRKDSFEIELYVSSRTKLSSSKIGMTNNTMGMSMKRIIELPEILP